MLSAASLSRASVLEGSTEPATNPATQPAYSSSLFAAPALEASAPAAAADNFSKLNRWTNTRPFRSVAVEMNFGIQGLGFQVATPLAKRFNLRGGADFFGLQHTFTTDDNLILDTRLHFRSVKAMVDYYPFGGSFRISPGLFLYNGNHAGAVVTVPAGQHFSVGDADYISSTADPITGTLDLKLGNQVAPAITLGWGNMLPRHGGHWSVPFEIGAEFIGKPTVDLNLRGHACLSTPCTVGPINMATDPTAQSNIKQQQNDYNNDLEGLQVYPIMSIGVSYSFGKK